MNFNLFIIILVHFYFVLAQNEAPPPAPVEPPVEPPPVQPEVTTPTTTSTTLPPPTTNPVPQVGDFKLDDEKKDSFLDWLISDTESDRHTEYEGYDGWYNNPTHPELGSVDSQLVRLIPPVYEDGVYKPSGSDRPNPLDLSRSFMSGPSGERSNTGKTALLVFFGQQVVEELLDVQRPGCPPEYFNIKIPKDHEYRKDFPRHSEMPILRSRYDFRTGQSPNNPRQQINEITPWIDGGLTYGISKGWSDGLRSFKDGLLASSYGGKYPALNDIMLPMANPPPPRDHRLKLVSRFFRLGNPRGNENPFLLTFGIFWFRWHNLIAKALKRKHPDEWSDEKIFNEARKWVIATHQHMIINEWLPQWLGEPLQPYEGYDSSIDPGIAHEFQTTAMRFGHTLVTSGGYRRAGQNGNCQVFKTTNRTVNVDHRAVRTCNSFWNPQEAVMEHDIDGILLGLASQPSEREDNVIVEDLRGRVFGPLEFSRRDLMAINIQRARDHGLTDYNSARRALGLEPLKDYQDMARKCENVATLNPKIFSEVMPSVFGANGTLGINRIDMWVGGILETEKTRPGELFRKIISNQMKRIRDGDRFWFENKDNGHFKTDQIERIKKINMYSMIWAVTQIKHGDLQLNPFRLPANTNPGLNDECRIKMDMLEYECFNPETNRSDRCFYLEPLIANFTAKCTVPETFDYFDGSRESFALTFVSIALFIIACVVILLSLSKKSQRRKEALTKALRHQSMKKKSNVGENEIIATEWVGQNVASRQVLIKMNQSKMISLNRLEDGVKLRFVDLTRAETIELQVGVGTYRGHHYILVRVAREYDMVFRFATISERDDFIHFLEEYIGSIGVGRQRREIAVRKMMKEALTKADRQSRLEKFFRVVFSQALGIEHSAEEILQMDTIEAREVISTEITLIEFAEALAMRPDAIFVVKMFGLADKENKGYISFREFLNMIVIFAKGTPEEKMKLMFDMYDIDNSGKLSFDEFSLMIRSMLEMGNQSLSPDKLKLLLISMFKKAGLTSKEELMFEDFLRLMSDNKEELGYSQLAFGNQSKGLKVLPPEAQESARRSVMIKALFDVTRAYSDSSGMNRNEDDDSDSNPREIRLQKREQNDSKTGKFFELKRYIDNYSLHIFWVFLYTLLICGIFVERSYYYAIERELSGLRRIAGFGISITRGAASAMMFAYSTILLTMCRNLITFFRETFLKNYIPFDSAITFHKYISFCGLFFSAVHIIGHAFNFYHISTQTADDLTCLFRDYFHATHELPKFHYWCFQTVTGLTGILLVLLMSIIYIFAIPFARRNVFQSFWLTHSLYPIFYILMTLHGLGRIVQDPFFYYFLLGPLCVFILDSLISISRKKKEISLMKTIVHPSDVIELRIKRPLNFEYKSGQWIRIACKLLNSNEYHPFTISTAPHEDYLSLHIRAIGPWTINMKNMLDPNKVMQHAYPKLYLDGPYGEGHQDWCNYEVSVLVGGGIGVTPFASILKDVVHKASLGLKLQCKKVFFLWVTRTQKHFEWLTDIIRSVEENDANKLVECHIFITQLYGKFDLRTTMLFVCERHFQRISNRSLFSGLNSLTHFGRPDFVSFFQTIQTEYGYDLSKVGVFSCGPPPMTLTVQDACDTLNKKDGTLFVHHYENF